MDFHRLIINQLYNAGLPIRLAVSYSTLIINHLDTSTFLTGLNNGALIQSGDHTMLKHGFEGLIPNSPDTNNPLTWCIGRGDETSSCNRPFLSHPRQLVTASDSGERIKRHLVTDRPPHLCLLVSASALEEGLKHRGFRSQRQATDPTWRTSGLWP